MATRSFAPGRPGRHQKLRRLVPWLALLALACAQSDGDRSAASPSLAGRAAGFNVVLISVDTLRADYLGSYGYSRFETSPEIDALLSRGVRFAEAQAPRSITWPSLASTLTGLYPSGHGLIYNGFAFQDDQSTLPTLLQEQGYETAAFLSNMCKANHRGWDSFFCAGGVDQRVNRQAASWLESRDASRPFLLWAHYFGPHPPYYNGGERARELDPGYAGELAPKKGVLDRLVRERTPLDDADLGHLEAIYAAAVMGSDRYVGDLLATLEASGQMQRTVVVFLADHGEDLYQHNGYLYHACSVYQTSLHVPLGFIAPGLLTAGTVAQPVELVDVLPTLLELLGLESPACMDGASLLPYLEQPERGGPGKPAFSEYGDTRIRTVLHDGWKLVSNPDALTPECMPGAPPDLYPIGELELYDLRSDPLEQTDVASDHPDRVRRLSRLLEARSTQLCGGGQGDQEIPEDLRKELESLGYVAR